ncbi:Spy/CpxP family protein refolding chaperone [Hydrogenimonas urashimensis]|uniref:Spy/CpxP family protein refolding chaperone n=1 Tax=Hydrogenimonas urashimensis TaxID=2740515 RepID=UPI0019165897|nr:Spy/CpxP family protein refolding chaperone [Hydrogenimonas urashimensis]
MFKRALAMIAAASIALTAAQAQPENPQMQGQKHMQGKKKMRGMHSVFLIQRGLPHYSMILMKMWDNPKLALTPEQKTKLEAIRTHTMTQIKEIAPQVKQLRKKIVQESKSGAKPETLAANVDKLASLKAKATKVQLQCIYDTRQVLTAEQLEFIHKHLKHKMKKHKQKKREHQ